MTILLDDITSGDPTRVRSSACAVIKLREKQELGQLASNLESIENNTKNLSLGGALFQNAEHLKFSIRKLKYIREQAGCLCELYPEYLMYNPQQEAKAGNIIIESITYIDEKLVDTYTCACTGCGRRYRVEEREYHYTWGDWKAMTQQCAAGDARNART